MAERSVVFGLFAKDEASKVFKEVGKNAQNSAKETELLAKEVESASKRQVMASNKNLDAQAKLGIEQMKLTELGKKANVTEIQMVTQKERVASASRNAVIALTESERATRGLSSAESALVAKSAEARSGILGFGNAVSLTKEKMSGFLKTALAGGVALAAYKGFQLAKDSVKAAEDFQTAHVKLQVAVKDSGKNFKDFAVPVEDLSTKFRHLGFTDTETQDALAVLTTSLKDPTKAMALMSVTADVARARSKPLAEVALAVAKGYEGQLRPLRALGLDAPVAAGGLLKLQTAHENLAKAQAKLAADSNGSAGEMSVAKTNELIKAQTHYAKLQDQYGNSFVKTEAQSRALEKARLSVIRLQGASSTSSNSYAKDLAAVEVAQKKVNDTANAGNVIIDTVTKGFQGQAASAADTYAIKLKALNANFDHMKVGLGGPIMNGLSKFSDWMNKDGFKALDKIGSFAKNNGREIAATFAAIGTFFAITKIGEGIAGLVGMLGKIGKAFEALKVIAVGTAAAEAAATDGASVIPGLAAAAGIFAAFGVASTIMGSGSNKTAKADKIAIDKAFNQNYSMPSGYSPLFGMTAGTSNIHIHIAGSVLTESEIYTKAHDHIAQAMIRAGKNPAVIGKR